MISRRLWRALNNPPKRHPLFKFVLAHANRDEFKMASGFFMWIFMLTIICFFWTIVVDWVSYMLLAVLILWNTVYALRWTLRISETITAEKEFRRYDLLAILPFGKFGTSWAISTGCLHRRSSFRWMPYFVRAFAIIVSSTLIFALLLTVFVMNQANTDELRLANEQLLHVAAAMIPFLLVFYIDHIYSILTSVLFGMVATLEVRLVTEAKLRAFLGFLAVQIFTYAFATTTMLWAIPALFERIGLVGLPSIILNAVIGVALYVALREWLIRQMWRILMNSLSAEEKDVSLVLQSVQP